ncbi:small integral membrane protein 26 [Rhinatrema bivittatum]|uniref:small integral membrane protein 26 n=1 Tax=Rhinatrema bivittatum TaxID=194408 RepID=UPI0011282B05|nr:small integral membrane protein 26 [Rhinatrema bivittatum]
MVSARNIAKWNTRVSLLYAVGIWTMLGTFGYFQIKRKRENPEAGEAAGHDEELKDDLTLQSKTEEKRRTGFYITETVTYKKDFVPYSTRIYNFITSHLNSTSDAASDISTSEK